MRRPWILLPLLALALPLGVARAGEDPPPAEAPLVVREWLLLDAVDVRARRPLGPEAVFRRHLLDPASPPPEEGQEVTGELGVAKAWRRAAGDEAGRLDPGRAAWACGSLEAPEAGVFLLRLTGASTAYVNGVPIAGDVYGQGLGRLPVTLEAGPNRVFLAGFRGEVRCTFSRSPSPQFPAVEDATVPDLVPGGPSRLDAAAVVVNPTPSWATGLSLVAEGSPTPVPSIPPLGAVKAPFAFPSPAVTKGARDVVVPVALRDSAGTTLRTLALRLEVRAAGEAHRRTFRSAIDGSVQFFAVLPPSGPPAESDRPRLVLTLHGASVDALNQARAYAPKPGVWIVAPTNRRPFGFDWQDWGRRDAYEVLAEGLRLSGVDRRDVHLTGHSMGGHGTWHLAANDPDGFASIAPSAGWISFDTYGGRRPESPLDRIWRAADLASDTLGLVPNLVALPTYVLHGSADDNVPASEATRMVEAIRGAGGTPTIHLEEGAGHWWDRDPRPGADCVDWPSMFEQFARARIPADPDEVSFTTADPGVDAEHFWVRIEQPERSGERSTIRARRVPGGDPVVESVNVHRWAVRGADGTWRSFVRGPSGPVPAAPLAYVEKSPARCGPLKRAFDRRFVMVVGTAGTDEEDAAFLAKARHDAHVWWIRGNGLGTVVTDTAFLADPDTFRGRNVVLYGHREANAAWEAVVDPEGPVDVTRARVRVGGRAFEGPGLAVLCVRPRRDDDRGLVGIVGASGVAGSRLALLTAYLASGTGYPDLLVWGSEVLDRGTAGVRIAAFFDRLWDLAE